MRCMVDKPEHSVKVTKIGKGWNIRVLIDGAVNQELRVYDPRDIGTAAREMLRWEDKCGNWSDYARASRERNFANKKPQFLGFHGKVDKIK